MNRFADRLVAGECKAVLIAGSELLATLFSALRNGQDLSAWTEGGDEEAESLGQDKEMTHTAEHAHGLFEPINVYPLFESALRHHKGLDSDSHLSLVAVATIFYPVETDQIRFCVSASVTVQNPPQADFATPLPSKTFPDQE